MYGIFGPICGYPRIGSKSIDCVTFEPMIFDGNRWVKECDYNLKVRTQYCRLINDNYIKAMKILCWMNSS